jgi:hypothetical protein
MPSLHMLTGLLLRQERLAKAAAVHFKVGRSLVLVENGADGLRKVSLSSAGLLLLALPNLLKAVRVS